MKTQNYEWSIVTVGLEAFRQSFEALAVAVDAKLKDIEDRVEALEDAAESA